MDKYVKLSNKTFIKFTVYVVLQRTIESIIYMLLVITEYFWRFFAYRWLRLQLVTFIKLSNKAFNKFSVLILSIILECIVCHKPVQIAMTREWHDLIIYLRSDV